MRTSLLVLALVVLGGCAGGGLPSVADARKAVTAGQAGVDKALPALEALRAMGVELCTPGAERLPVGDCERASGYLSTVFEGFHVVADGLDAADQAVAVIEAFKAAAGQ